MNPIPKKQSSPLVERIFGDPGSIAPSVDKVWRDAFMVELRLLSVPGERIGDALLTVEAHVAESGERAEDAFGDAQVYAREIARATGDAGRGWAVSTTTVVGTLLGLLGMLVTLRAFASWLQQAPAGITAGELVGLGVLILLAGAIFFTRTLRFLVEHRWVMLPVPVLLVGGLVALFVLLGEPLFEVPALPLGIVGVLLLVVSVVLTWREQPGDLDQITAPGRAASVTRRARLFAASTFPLMTMVLLLFSWLLNRVAV